jgi:hypothetical protein
LRQPRHQGRRRWREARQLAERGQDVIGPDGRRHVPNNHSKYGTCGVSLISGTPVYLKLDHGGAGIHPPDSLPGEALHLRGTGGEEDLDRPGRVSGRYPGKYNLPVGCLQPQGTQLSGGRAAGHLKNLNHINSARQGSVEPIPHIGGCARSGEAEF